ELLARVRETALGAYAHQDLPFEQLVEALQPRRDLTTSPLFQVFFALQNVPMEELALSGLSLRPLAAPGATAKFDLSVSMLEGDEGIEAAFEYSTDLFEEPTVRRMAGHLQSVLEAVVSDPDAPVAELPVQSEADR